MPTDFTVSVVLNGYYRGPLNSPVPVQTIHVTRHTTELCAERSMHGILQVLRRRGYYIPGVDEDTDKPL